MSAHGHDERLSAFYDGELSAVERAEVERLVTDRPDLRSELSSLSDLSQRLSDLADNLPEVDLRPRVLQRIADIRPVSSPSRTLATSQRRWMPGLLMVCSLSLLLAALLPLFSTSNQTGMVAKNEGTDRRSGESGLAIEAVAVPSSMKSEMQVTADSLSEAPKGSIMAVQSGGMGGGGLGDPISEEAQTSELLARIVKERDLKPGELISQVLEGGDFPVLAEYTVVDVKQSAQTFEVLLRKHGIVPLVPSSGLSEKAASDRAKDQPAKEASTSELMVFLVDANSEPLNAAMFEYENLREVVALNYEPLALYEADSALLASRAKDQADGLPAEPAPAAAAAEQSAPAAEPITDSQLAEKKRISSQASLRQAKSADPQVAPDDSVVLSDKILDVERDKLPVDIHLNGNVLVIENGEALCAEIQYRQVQISKSSNSQNSRKQDLSNPPFLEGRSGRRNGDLKTNSQNGPAILGNRGYQESALQNFNSINGSRSRQRAILVLRPQSPPPPPEPTRVDP